MRTGRLPALLFTCLVLPLAACEGNDGKLEAGNAGSGGGAIETDLTQLDSSEEMERFLNAHGYGDWTADAQDLPRSEHASLARIYVDPNAAAAIRAGSPSFPAGAAAVKELLRDGELLGWAVWVKLDADSAGGMGFYWWEAMSGGTPSQGRGNDACVGCHEGGRDYLLATLRLPAE